MARKFKRLVLRISDIQELEGVSYRIARDRFKKLVSSLELTPDQKPNIAQYAKWNGWKWKHIMELMSN